jgi:hypothetical protein
MNAGDLQLLRRQVAFTEKRNKNAICFFCWNIYSIPAMIRQACFRFAARPAMVPEAFRWSFRA